MAIKNAGEKFVQELPLIGGIFDDSEEKAIAELQRNQDLYRNLATPDVQWQDFVPEEYRYQGDYTPQMAQYEKIQEDAATRQKQLESLGAMQEMAKTGLSAQDELGYDQARQLGAQMSRAGTETALQDARRRGISGGGQEVAMREMANQAGAERARQAAMEQAANAAQQRAAYQQIYSSSLGNLRGQDYNAAQANADIINRFHQMNTAEQNAAQQANLANRQAIGNTNVSTRNQATQGNLQGRQDTAQQGYQNQLSRLQGISDAGQGMAQAYGAQGATRQAGRNANTALAANILFPGSGEVLTADQKARKPAATQGVF